MSRFLELNDAAKQLGVTPDELMEMRQRGEIHGYRDGASWKFKPEEVERVKGEMSSSSASDSAYDLAFDHLMPGAPAEDEPSSELDSVSILVSDESLGQSPPTSSSTIIGKKKNGEKAADSDIKLAGERPADSGLGLLADAGSSDLKLAGDSGVLGGPEAQLKSPDAGGTGELQLAADGPPGIGSDALSVENELDLGDGNLALGEDSDDLVLGGSGVGSDVSLDPGGSGINLSKPSDSGLSLEEPLELGGSQVESLELPEDEDMVALGDVASDPDQATMLKQDEEFALSPVADMVAEDSSDSGSQVIALEDSDAFDQNSPTMLGPADQGVLLPDNPADLAAGGMPMGFGGVAGGAATMGPGAAAMMPQPAQQQGYAPAGPVEAPYSIWNVLGLLAVFLVMGLTGALMVDVLRNMWAFDSSATLSTSIMDMIIDFFKM